MGREGPRRNRSIVTYYDVVASSPFRYRNASQSHLQYPYGIDIRTGDRDPTECAGYSGYQC